MDITSLAIHVHVCRDKCPLIEHFESCIPSPQATPPHTSNLFKKRRNRHPLDTLATGVQYCSVMATAAVGAPHKLRPLRRRRRRRREGAGDRGGSGADSRATAVILTTLSTPEVIQLCKVLDTAVDSLSGLLQEELHWLQRIYTSGNWSVVK